MRRVLSLLFAAHVAAGLVAWPAEAADAPGVVAVLYFDNNSNDPSWDVLRKGLADMMVTDLSGVPGVQVVEREKLQALLSEMKLQRTRYFDPATAQRIGQGLGARWAVTGAVTAVDPSVRIDVRLIEVATAKVAMADKVVGTKDRFFELESELASRFARAMNVRFAPRDGGGQAVDLDAVLIYSKGLDAADRGDLDGASKHLAAAVTKAPSFRLAVDRYATLLRRLHDARARRDAVLGSGEAALVASVKEALAHPEALEGRDEEARRFLAYRTLHCQYLFLTLGRILGLAGPDLDTFKVFDVPPDRRAEAGRRMREFFEEAARLSRELRAWEERPKVRPGSHEAKVAAEDAERGKAIGIREPGRWTFATSWRVARAAAQFALLGKPDMWLGLKFGTNPPLAQVDPGTVAAAIALLDSALAGVEKARMPSEEMRQRDTIEVLDTYALGLMRLGRRTEAVARWQTVLDRWPTCDKYAEFERNIQDALGVPATDPALSAALDRCDGAALIGPWATIAIPRAQKAGPSAFDEMAEEVSQRCGSDPRFQPMADTFWFSAASVALAAGGGCDFAKRMLPRIGNSPTGQAIRPGLEQKIRESCR